MRPRHSKLFCCYFGIWVLTTMFIAVGTTNAQAPIKIGLTSDFSGAAAVFSRSLGDGAKLAVEKINSSGGILGRKVQVIEMDNQSKPELAVSQVRDLITREKVDGFVGSNVSSVALAQSQACKLFKKPVIFTQANTQRITMDQGHPYAFMTVTNTLMESRVFAETTARKYSNFGWLANDYEAGHQFYNATKARLEQINPRTKFVAEAWPKVGETDFTPYITKILAAKPEMVHAILWGAHFVGFVKQAKPYGFFEKTKLTTIVALDDLRGLGDEMPDGIFGIARCPFFGLKGPKIKEFVKKYRDRYGDYPSDFAITSYEAVEILAQAISKAGSTDPDAMVKAMERFPYQGLRGEGSEGEIIFRKEDHQANVAAYFGRIAKSPEYSSFKIMVDIERVPAENVWASLEELEASRRK